MRRENVVKLLLADFQQKAIAGGRGRCGARLTVENAHLSEVVARLQKRQQLAPPRDLHGTIDDDEERIAVISLAEDVRVRGVHHLLGNLRNATEIANGHAREQGHMFQEQNLLHQDHRVLLLIGATTSSAPNTRSVSSVISRTAALPPFMWGSIAAIKSLRCDSPAQ